jgi:AcrR family transcriptional regulator
MARNPRYDRDDLVRAGLELVGRSGFDSVTLRSIAGALGISPMALYRVVPDAETLKEVIADVAAEGLHPSDGSLDDALEGWATQAYASLSKYPGIAGFVLHRWTDLPGWLTIVDTLLGIASREGIEGPLAVARVNAVFAFVLARAQLRESVGGSTRSLRLLDAFPDRFDHVRANREEFVVAESDRHFRFGLSALLAGLRALEDSASGLVVP